MTTVNNNTQYFQALSQVKSALVSKGLKGPELRIAMLKAAELIEVKLDGAALKATIRQVAKEEGKALVLA